MKKLLICTSALFFTTAAASANDFAWQQPTAPAVAEYPTSAYPVDNYAYPSDTYVPPAQVSDVQPQSGNGLSEDLFFTGNVGVVTDYRNRGVSRSDGPAIQGRAELGYNGVYAGINGSTVDMSIDNDANIEAAFFGGYRGVFDGLDYDGRLSYTTYPGGDNDDMDYWEFTLTGGYDFDVFYGSLTWAISPDYINDTGVTLYYGADLSAPLPQVAGGDLSAKAHLGFQFIGDDNRYVDDNAMDWLLGLNYNVPTYDVDMGLSWVGTSLDDDDCTEDCGSMVLLSVGKSFGHSGTW